LTSLVNNAVLCIAFEEFNLDALEVGSGAEKMCGCPGGSLSQIDFPAYIRQLAAHLFHSYGVSAERIRLRTDFDMLYLSLDAAVPCELITNELLSDSLKYAFPDGLNGEVRIELRQRADGVARLIVATMALG
jgi:two-component sensor histidine kinase